MDEGPLIDLQHMSHITRHRPHTAVTHYTSQTAYGPHAAVDDVVKDSRDPLPPRHLGPVKHFLDLWNPMGGGSWFGSAFRVQVVWSSMNATLRSPQYMSSHWLHSHLCEHAVVWV